MGENWLLLFSHVQYKSTNAPVQQVELINAEIGKRAKGWLKKIWMELVRKDMDANDLNKDIAR